MIRSIAFLLALVGASPVLMGQEALAATDEALDLQKSEVDYAKDKWKALEKLAGTWHKNQDKGAENGDTEKELKEYYREELAHLRDLGIPTVEEEAPVVHPTQKDKVEPVPEEDREKLVHLRDILVELKTSNGADKAKRYGSLLDEYVAVLKDRYERKDKKYQEAKDAAK